MRRRPQLHLLAALAALSIAAGAAAAPRDGGPPQHLMQLEQEPAARPLAARGAGWGDPHYIAFSGQKFSVCVKKAGLECQGKAFNLISEARHQVNVELQRFKGPDTFPQSGTWMTGFGVRFHLPGGRESSVELKLKTDVEYQIVDRKAQHPDGSDGKYRSLVASFTVDGQDVMDRLESGPSLKANGMRVYFPKTRHPHDPTDGPLAIVATPDMRIYFLLESDDIWHLDVQANIFEGHELSKMHGLLGQTMEWNTGTEPAAPEGDELDYALHDGLLGRTFKYNQYAPTPREEQVAAS